MNARHRVFATLLLVMSACAGSPAQAQAFYLSGSFSGIAQAELLPLNFPPPLPVSYYDGAPVTGTFAVYVTGPMFQVGGDDYAYFLNGNGGSLSISYTIKDTQFSFQSSLPYGSSGPSVMLLSNGSTSQTLSFLTDFQPKYQGAEFDLTGPPGSLFTGLDASTLHVDASNPPSFNTSFASSSAEVGVTVAINVVTFQTTMPVPEPGTGGLALAGGALLACSLRRANLKALQRSGKRSPLLRA